MLSVVPEEPHPWEFVGRDTQVFRKIGAEWCQRKKDDPAGTDCWGDYKFIFNNDEGYVTIFYTVY